MGGGGGGSGVTLGSGKPGSVATLITWIFFQLTSAVARFSLGTGVAMVLRTEPPFLLAT